MIRAYNNMSTRTIAKRLVSTSNERFRSFIASTSTSNETESKSKNNRPGRIHPYFVTSALGPSLLNRNDYHAGASTTFASTRGFSSSAGTGTGTGTGAGTMSPEEEMAKFEQSANTTLSQSSDGITPVSDQLTTTGQQIWESTWWPQDQMLDLIMFTQETSGLNFALTIGAITFTFRSLMFPLFVKAQKNSSRMAHMKPEMDVLKSKIDRLDSKDIQEQQKYARAMQDLFKKYDVHPLRAIAFPFIQMPVFMSMFFALKKMPDYFSEELSTGGILWFTDLSQPDPYYILPTLSGLTFLAMMEMGKKQMVASMPEQGNVMLNFFRGMAVMIVPISAYFPACILCYWTVNNTFSFVQSAVMKSPTVRDSFGIWEPPKPVPGAPKPKGVFDMMKNSMENKKKEGSDMNLKERMEMHNAAIDKRVRGRKKKRSK
jgi:YidC/Oxa1 family membrane protein insertase